MNDQIQRLIAKPESIERVSDARDADIPANDEQN